MRRFFGAAVWVLLLGLTVPTFADTIGESLEWLVLSRPGIGIANVTETEPIEVSDPKHPELRIHVHLKTVLKGEPPPDADFVRRWQKGAIAGQEDNARPDDGTEYLVMYDDGGNVTNAFNLLYPSGKLGIGASPQDVALATDFSILKSRGSILETLQRALGMVKAAEAAPGGGSEKELKPGSKQVPVPLDTPAWSILYNGEKVVLLVPDKVSNHWTEDKAANFLAQFSGFADGNDCGYMPKRAFALKTNVPGQPHTLLIQCSMTDPGHGNLTLIFHLVNVLREGDYEFRWGPDPDLLPEQLGEFTHDEVRCEKIIDVLRNRVNSQIRIVRDETHKPSAPILAQWRAECSPDDRWGTAIAFYLSLRKENPSDPNSALPGVVPGSPAAASSPPGSPATPSAGAPAAPAPP